IKVRPMLAVARSASHAEVRIEDERRGIDRGHQKRMRRDGVARKAQPVTGSRQLEAGAHGERARRSPQEAPFRIEIRIPESLDALARVSVDRADPGGLHDEIEARGKPPGELGLKQETALAAIAAPVVAQLELEVSGPLRAGVLAQHRMAGEGGWRAHEGCNK